MSDAPEQLALFAPPPFTPNWPSRGTQADKALGLLLDGRHLDHPTFEAEAGSWRLAAVVFELRALGWPVQASHKPAPTPDCPGRYIAVYRLSARALADLVAVQRGERT